MGGTGRAGAEVWRTRHVSGVYTNEECRPAEPSPALSGSERGQKGKGWKRQMSKQRRSSQVDPLRSHVFRGIWVVGTVFLWNVQKFITKIKQFQPATSDQKSQMMSCDKFNQEVFFPFLFVFN